MDVGPQFKQQQLADIGALLGPGGGEARPIARVEHPTDGPRMPSPTMGRRGEQFQPVPQGASQFDPNDKDAAIARISARETARADMHKSLTRMGRTGSAVHGAAESVMRHVQKYREQGPAQPGVERMTLGGHVETPEQTEQRLGQRSADSMAGYMMGASATHWGPHDYRVPSSPGVQANKGEQLKMFMTPAEIHEGWQALDADRREIGHETYKTGSSWNPSTPSTAGSEWGDLAHNKEKPEQPQHGRTPGGGWFNRTAGGNKWVQHERDETDEELYARKLDEAQGFGDEDMYEPKMVGGKSSHWSGETYHPASGSKSSWESPQRYTPGEEGMWLHDAIGEQGVTHPVRLGQTIGSMNKPEIVGGHHRLASATEHANWGNWSHQFLPVLHHRSIQEARSDTTKAAWKYT